MASVQPIPEDYPRLIPYITMDGAADAMAFYAHVLGAQPRGDAMQNPEGKIQHAEMQIGDSLFMLADADPMFKNARDLGGSPVNLCVYVEDADAVMKRAKDRGAKVVQEPEDKFYGDRSGTFEDPWGYQWTAMTRIENVSPQEMARRAQELMKNA